MTWTTTFSFLTSILIFTGCNASPSAPDGAEVKSRTEAKPLAEAKAVNAQPTNVALSPQPTPAIVAPVRAPGSPIVKRFLAATGVQEREPLSGDNKLTCDGSPIYAFAELANPEAESSEVRLTFERQGATERGGNVMLKVPGNVGRHRTWGVTRTIRAAGVWDAVLWTQSGVELARTSFEVGGC